LSSSASSLSAVGGGLPDKALTREIVRQPTKMASAVGAGQSSQDARKCQKGAARTRSNILKMEIEPAASSERQFVSVVNGDKGTAQSPKHRIFVSADIPQPFPVRHPIDGACHNAQMDSRDDSGPWAKKPENEKNRQNCFNDTGRIHPEFGWLESGRLKEPQRRGLKELSCNMRDEK
jgi:hypothetical protein